MNLISVGRKELNARRCAIFWVDPEALGLEKAVDHGFDTDRVVEPGIVMGVVQTTAQFSYLLAAPPGQGFGSANIGPLDIVGLVPVIAFVHVDYPGVSLVVLTNGVSEFGVVEVTIRVKINCRKREREKKKQALALTIKCKQISPVQQMLNHIHRENLLSGVMYTFTVPSSVT